MHIPALFTYTFLNKAALFCSAATLLASARLAEGATFTVSSFYLTENNDVIYNTYVDTTGQFIPSGTGYVALGIFPNNTFEQLLTKTFFEFASDFQPVVSSTFGGTGGAETSDGVFYYRQNSFFEPAAGSRAYFMVANGPLAAATEYALISGVWKMDANSGVLYADTTDLIAGRKLDPGVPNPDIDPDYIFDGSFQLVPGTVKPIPEPALTMLLLAGGSFFLMRRKF